MRDEPLFYIWPVDVKSPTYTHSRTTDECYIEYITNCINSCVDVVPYCPTLRSLILPRRRVRPMRGSPWMIGGRRLSGEPTRIGAVRHFEHDTGIVLAPERLQFIGINEYLFHDREQYPQNIPCHSQCTMFAVALKSDEQSRMNRMRNTIEYTSDETQLYDWEMLQQAEIHPAIRGCWMKIFEDAIC